MGSQETKQQPKPNPGSPPPVLMVVTGGGLKVISKSPNLKIVTK